jgi:hypothetical protein
MELQIKHVAIAVAVMLIGFWGIYVTGSAMGKISACQDFGGVLMDSGMCINMSSLGYCQRNNQIYEGATSAFWPGDLQLPDERTDPLNLTLSNR